MLGALPGFSRGLAVDATGGAYFTTSAAGTATISRFDIAAKAIDPLPLIGEPTVGGNNPYRDLAVTSAHDVFYAYRTGSSGSETIRKAGTSMNEPAAGYYRGLGADRAGNTYVTTRVGVGTPGLSIGRVQELPAAGGPLRSLVLAGWNFSDPGPFAGVAVRPQNTALVSIGGNSDGVAGNRDAEHMRDTLRGNLRSYDSERSTLLDTSPSPIDSTEVVKNELNARGKRLGAQDTMVVYISGHGDVEVDGPYDPFKARLNHEGVTKGADWENGVEGTDWEYRKGKPLVLLNPDDSLTAVDLHTILSDDGFGFRKLVILDSCYSGGFINELINTDTHNIAVLAASSAGDFAWTDDDGSGVMTHLLMMGMSRDASGNFRADANLDGSMTLKELADYVHADADGYARGLLGEELALRGLSGTAPFEGVGLTYGMSPDFVDGLDFPLAAVPEPGACVLIVSCVSVFACRRSRRRRV